LSYSQTDLATLRSALASGVRSVRFEDGRQVEYQSVSDLIRTIGVVERALVPVASRVSHVNPIYSKGT
jgi:hypothetical protein